MYCSNNIALTTKSSMYMYYTSLLATPCYQILQLPNPHPTLKNQKLNFNQCNFVNIYLLKQCSNKCFKLYENFNEENFYKSVNTETFPRIPTTFILCLYFSQILTEKNLLLVFQRNKLAIRL